MRRNLSPALFPSWQATCKAFGAAISAGPGLVLLVGGPGSGKTFTLLAFAEGASSQKVSLRSINEPVEPGTEIDLVDNFDAKALGRLGAFEGTRAVAIRPDLVATVKTAFPDARIVTVRPMSSRDVRMMVEVRRPQLGLPVGYFTSKALTRMDELCLGNPRQLDDLLFLSLRLVAAAATARVAPGHVERAALQLVMEQSGDARGAASLHRETVLDMLSQAEAQRMKFGRGAPPAGANASSSPAHNPAARRGVQPMSARSTGRAPATHEAANRPSHSAAALTLAGAPSPAHNRRPLPTRAKLEQAGSRNRRSNRKSYALAAVAVVALAVTVREVPSRLSWLSGGGQSLADAGPDVAKPPPPAAATASPSSIGNAVPAPAPAVMATAAVREKLGNAGLPEKPPPAPDLHAAQPQNTLVAAAPAPKAPKPIETRHAAPTPPAAPGAVPQPPEAQAASVAPADPDQSAVAGPTNDEARLPAVAPSLAPSLAPDPPVAAPLPEPTIAVRPPSSAPAPRPEEAVGSASAARPKDAKEAARLLSLGKALFAINQIADAKEVMKSSAEMGNSEAAAFMAAYDAPSAPRRPRSRTVSPVEHDSARTRLPIGTVARQNRD